MTTEPTEEHWRLEVAWDDSTVNNGRWVDIDDVLSAENRAVTRVRSVGFVLADDDIGIVLAASVHGHEASGVVHIPRGSVRERHRLT